MATYGYKHTSHIRIIT